MISFEKRTRLQWNGLVGRLFKFSFPLPAIAFSFAATGARGQDAIQMFYADKQLDSSKNAISDPDYYNIKTGPVNLRFQSTLQTEFTDNVNYTGTNRVADVYFQPAVNMRAYWPVTLNNSLFFNTGIGYTFYVKDSNLDHLDINPDSSLSFQMFVGGVAIDVHDRFSMSEDVSQSPTVSGSGNFVQIENTGGADATWDLNKLIVTAGYDHDWVNYVGSDFKSSDHNSDYLYSRAALTNSLVTTGVEAGTGLTYYEQNVFSDNAQANVGAFVQAPLSDHISLDAAAGFAGYFFTSSGTTADLSNILGYYANVSLNHRVNLWFNYSISGGRRLGEDTGVDLLQLYFVNCQATFNLIHDLPISAQFIFEHGREYGGAGDTFNRYGVTVDMKYQISERLSGAIEYAFWNRNSNVASDSYVQNDVSLQLSYNF